MRGLPRLDMGKSGVVESDDGFVILLTSLAVMPISLVQLEVVNINPGAFRVIVAKGVQSPLPAYGPISAEHRPRRHAWRHGAHFGQPELQTPAQAAVPFRAQKTSNLER